MSQEVGNEDVTMRTLLIGLGVAAGLYVTVLAVLFVSGRRTVAGEVAVLLPNLLLLFKGLVRDPRVPLGSKALLVLGAAWVASPIDLIPEFIPILGPLDDAVVAALILRHLVRTTGADVVAEHWRGDQATLDRLLRLVGSRTVRGDPRSPGPRP